MNKILVVDDEIAVRYAFTRAFSKDYQIITAENGNDAVKKVIEYNPDLVFMDIKMPGMNGIETLKKIKEINSTIPIILITAFADTDTAIEAMKEGAYEYITKPFDNNTLKIIIEKVLSSSKKLQENSCLPEENKDIIGKIVGRSNAILNVCKLIGQVAPTDVPVLITGESGVGKELVAKAIHYHSKRKDKPFIAVNCAAIPNTLIESELFGYEEGAFTGAERRRIGKFEQGNGGTIFLDEIGDMDLINQAKILRVLQDSSFERLGGNHIIKVDVRIIAATNKNLPEEVSNGRFRNDLYHRLNVVSIHIPPLRERKEDIPLLVEYFIKKANKETGHNIQGISHEAISLLENYSWPGNVRELENVIRRAVILSKGNVINKEDIIFTEQKEINKFHEAIEAIVQTAFLYGEAKPYEKIISEVEKAMIQKALEITKGNQVKASALLGITRMTLRKKIDEYNIIV